MSGSRFRTHLVIRNRSRSRRSTAYLRTGVGVGNYQPLKPRYLDWHLRRHIRGLLAGPSVTAFLPRQ